MDAENGPFSLALLYAMGKYADGNEDAATKGAQISKLFANKSSSSGGGGSKAVFPSNTINPRYKRLLKDQVRVECILGRLKFESKLEDPLRLLEGIFHVAKRPAGTDNSAPWQVSWQRLARFYFELGDAKRATQDQVCRVADGLAKMRRLDEPRAPLLQISEFQKDDCADLNMFDLGLLWALGTNADFTSGFPGEQLLLNEGLTDKFNRLIALKEPATPPRLIFLYSKTFHSFNRVNAVFELFREECGLMDPRHLMRCVHRYAKEDGRGAEALQADLVAKDYFLVETPSAAQVTAVEDALCRLRAISLKPPNEAPLIDFARIKPRLSSFDALSTISKRTRDSATLSSIPMEPPSPKRLRQQRHVTFAAAG